MTIKEAVRQAQWTNGTVITDAIQALCGESKSAIRQWLKDAGYVETINKSNQVKFWGKWGNKHQTLY